jgi:REP element-mobilizing transposase RayT
MVIAYHLIWTAYGWWLPNDPRGSMSRFIASDVIAELGTLHHGRKRMQPLSRIIREFYEHAAGALKFPLLTFSQLQINAIANAFAEEFIRQRYTCYACAIMPDHIHLVIRKHKHLAEQMIENLQQASRDRLLESNLVPNGHPVWGGDGWKVFLDHPDEIRRTIRYVWDNPIKMRLPQQQWEFVTDYDGWPLHPGHNPDSPYARAIRGK